MRSSEQRLIDAARRALVWFENHTKGNALNGQYDDILIARELHDALSRVFVSTQATDTFGRDYTSTDLESLDRAMADRQKARTK